MVKGTQAIESFNCQLSHSSYISLSSYCLLPVDLIQILIGYLNFRGEINSVYVLSSVDFNLLSKFSVDFSKKIGKCIHINKLIIFNSKVFFIDTVCNVKIITDVFK
jgi:hypothetical protein